MRSKKQNLLFAPALLSILEACALIILCILLYIASIITISTDLVFTDPIIKYFDLSFSGTEAITSFSLTLAGIILAVILLLTSGIKLIKVSKRETSENSMKKTVFFSAVCHVIIIITFVVFMVLGFSFILSIISLVGSFINIISLVCLIVYAIDKSTDEKIAYEPSSDTQINSTEPEEKINNPPSNPLPNNGLAKPTTITNNTQKITVSENYTLIKGKFKRSSNSKIIKELVMLLNSVAKNVSLEEKLALLHKKKIISNEKYELIISEVRNENLSKLTKENTKKQTTNTVVKHSADTNSKAILKKR